MALERFLHHQTGRDGTEPDRCGRAIEGAGLRIVAQKRIRMTRREAETFYAIHRERPFFGELVDFAISGPVVVQVLEGENAVAKYREIMGATNPENAAEGTIRKKFAKSVGETRCTAPTASRTPRSRSPSSSRATRSSADILSEPRSGACRSRNPPPGRDGNGLTVGYAAAP